MSLRFDLDAHRYTLDGLDVPSVTGILRDSGLIQFDGVPPSILEEARARGSAVHQLVHFYNETDLDWTSVDPNYRGYLEAWIRYRAEREVRPLLCEYRVASRRHRVAGTIDLLCDIAGEGWLVDFKTGRPEDVAADLQTGAYFALACEWAAVDSTLAETMTRHSRWRRASVRLRRDGSFNCAEYTDPRDFTRFQTLAAAWHIRNERGAILTLDEVVA